MGCAKLRHWQLLSKGARGFTRHSGDTCKVTFSDDLIRQVYCWVSSWQYFENRGQLHAEPHVWPISCHITSLSWQELEEELNKLLWMKVVGETETLGYKCLVVLK